MGSVRECICAIDQGTQSTRVYLFDKEANVLGSHQAEFTQYTPHAGWDLVPDHKWVSLAIELEWPLIKKTAAA